MTRWPLAITSFTTTVMVPLKSLLFSVVPLPSKLLAALPVAAARPTPKEFAFTPGKALNEASTLPLLSTELVDFCVALTFSMMLTRSVSPTTRARWSSKSGR